jgi:hypothetical protein
MSADLDLRDIHRHHEPDPQFVDALERRLTDLLAGRGDVGTTTAEADVVALPPQRRRAPYRAVLGAAAAVAGLLGLSAVVQRDDGPAPAVQSTPTVPAPLDLPAAAPTPTPIDVGTYRIPATDGYSIADLTATFPAGWTVQHGQLFHQHADTAAEVTFYPVTVDEIFADACAGTSGDVVEVGPGVDALVEALLAQAGVTASGPVATTVDGHPALRVDLTTPTGADQSDCNFGGDGLQIWYSERADDYFVLHADGVARVYIVLVEGQRQVFVTQYRTATADADVDALDALVASVRIDTSTIAAPSELPATPSPTPIEPGRYRIPAADGVAIADVDVSFPADWSVQRGRVFHQHADEADQITFFPAVVDEVYADACAGSEGADNLIEVGPGVERLADALQSQFGIASSGPVETMVGGYAALRLDLRVPSAGDLSGCSLGGDGMQVWYNEPADDYLVVDADGFASVYIVDVEGERQVFVTQQRTAATEAQRTQLEAMMTSIRIGA